MESTKTATAEGSIVCTDPYQTFCGLPEIMDVISIYMDAIMPFLLSGYREILLAQDFHQKSTEERNSAWTNIFPVIVLLLLIPTVINNTAALCKRAHLPSAYYGRKLFNTCDKVVSLCVELSDNIECVKGKIVKLPTTFEKFAEIIAFAESGGNLIDNTEGQTVNLDEVVQKGRALIMKSRDSIHIFKEQIKVYLKYQLHDDDETPLKSLKVCGECAREVQSELKEFDKLLNMAAAVTSCAHEIKSHPRNRMRELYGMLINAQEGYACIVEYFRTLENASQSLFDQTVYFEKIYSKFSEPEREREALDTIAKFIKSFCSVYEYLFNNYISEVMNNMTKFCQRRGEQASSTDDITSSFVFTTKAWINIQETLNSKLSDSESLLIDLKKSVLK